MTPERLAEIRARLDGERGPRQWKDGDPRVHCSRCERCRGFYRTKDMLAHEYECWVTHGMPDITALLAEVDRLTTRVLELDTLVRSLLEADGAEVDRLQAEVERLRSDSAKREAVRLQVVGP